MKNKFGIGNAKNNAAGVAIAMAVAQVFFATGAYAQSDVQHAYHIASGPLDRTLVEIAQSSKVRLSYDASLVQSLKSAPVDGTYTPEEAIRHALAGTGLKLESTSAGTLTIIKARAATNANPETSAAAAPAAASSAPASQEVDTTLPLISVAAQRDSGGTGFVTESSSTFSRTDTPISQTPTSVSSVNAAVIQSQNAQSLTDVLKNVAGVTTYGGNGLGVPGYAVRGFQNAAVLTDGMPTAQAGGLGSAAALTPTIAISSVEVLKGPAAILAGDAPAGGVINIVKKAPQADPFHEVQFSYGQYGNVTGAFDSTGAITSDKKLMYRFVMSDQGGGQNSMGYNGASDYYLAPTLEWKDRTTDITIGYDRTVSSNPIPQLTFGKTSGGFLSTRIDHPVGNPTDGFPMRQDDFFYKFEQKLGSHFTFVSKANYTETMELQRGWQPLSTLSATNGTPFMAFDTSTQTYNWAFENYLRAKYDFGPVKTTTLFGWDYTTGHFNEFEYNDGGKIVVVNNVFNPPTFPQLTGNGSGLAFTLHQQQTQSGLFFQEQANWQRIHFLGSIRNNQYWESGTAAGYSSSGVATAYSTGPGLHQSAWTPNVGLLYQLTEDVSAYANYQMGFVPSNSPVYGGGTLPPQRSSQEEAGLKGNFLDDKLAVTLAAYRISYTNQNISDPFHRGFSIAAGGAVSRGFELEVSGQILPGLNVIGQYTYDDYVMPYNPSVVVNMPKHSASLWTTYNFQSAMLQGVGVGLGFDFASSQQVGTSSKYTLGSQLETDVSLFYRHKNFGLNFAIKNVFNRNLYYSSTTPSLVTMGTPRTFLLTGTFDF
ncbi:TonB-dependent siderophore receptor [Paraburkholderia kururiensis]|uniref:TonB-dependent siderophore receptor n=1 Tax=Paraburkholderia kururiensis TaxID=984307 RepID=UPI00069398AA|nr:TonB-dependent receptor [Paraburkholderia kururiensis]